MAVHEQVFAFVLKVAQEKKLLRGKTVAVDSTTLEANAAMRTIVRKDTGEDWKQYVKGLMAEEGIENPTDEEMRRFDKKRKKKVSNKEWESPTDPDSRIAKMKDGRTHLAYKAEHTVDLDSEFVLAAAVHPADQADSATLVESVLHAQVNLVLAGSEQEIEEAVADKGYHKAQTLARVSNTSTPGRISRSRRAGIITGRTNPSVAEGNPGEPAASEGEPEQATAKEAERVGGTELCPCVRDRRRPADWLRGLENVTKRYVVQVAAHNLGLLMRKLFGIGKPRTLQGGGGVRPSGSLGGGIGG